MRSSLTSYARIIIGDKNNNSVVIDLSVHGEIKPTLKVTFSNNGVVKDTREENHKTKKMYLIEDVMKQVSKIIKKALLNESRSV